MWSVCKIKPGQAHIATINLSRQGYNTFNPCFDTKKLRYNKVVVAPEQLFPGYMFVEITEGQRWPPINSTLGVNRLMVTKSKGSEYYKPSAISDLFISRLMQCSSRDDEAGWRLAPGTQVKILKGPFAEHMGTLASWSSDDRCRLIIWLLGRDVTVEVHAADIVAV